MKKLLYVGIGLLGLLVLLVAAIFIVPNFIDWNSYKPEISEAVRKATGRDLNIAGDIDVGLSLGFELTVMVDGLELSNPPAAGDALLAARESDAPDAPDRASEPPPPAPVPVEAKAEPISIPAPPEPRGASPPARVGDMARIKRVEATIPLLSLLSDTVRVDSLIIYEPVLNLAVDADGQTNWAFEFETEGPDEEREESEKDSPSRYRDVKFGETRVQDGQINFDDATTEQELRVRDLDVQLMLESLSEPLVVHASMVLNDKPLSFNAAIDTPRSLMDGPEATASFGIESEPGKISYEGRVLVTPLPGLDGTFEADVPSVGQLLSWLDRPLAADQPDPGPLQIKAAFVGEEKKIELTEATIKGKGLDARANGSLDVSGPVAKLVLDVTAGFLDVDQYLPPPPKRAPEAKTRATTRANAKKQNLLAALSDEKLELGVLERLDATINVNIDGLNTRGYRLGKFAFVATAKDGVLKADLSKFALYGGNIAGKLSLDASGKELKADTALSIHKVRVDELAVAATGEESVVGIASANVKLATTGTSPRSLVQHLRGRVALDLGGVNVRNAPTRSISGLELVLELAGLDKDTKLHGNVTYNREKVTFSATTDPLERLAQSDRFATDLQVSSRSLKLRYRGEVAHHPALAGKGELVLDLPSVSRAAQWLGEPLAKAQRDPGKLHLTALITYANDRIAFEKARVDTTWLKADANGYLDRSRTIPSFDLNVENLDANFDALFPPSVGTPKGSRTSDASEGWSKKRFDFSGLSAANGKLTVDFKRVLYAGISTDRGRLSVQLERRNLEATVSNVAFSGGAVSARLGLDAGRSTPTLSYSLSAKGIRARPFLMQFADFDRISGVAVIETEGLTEGYSEYDFVNGLNGTGKVRFSNGAIHGVNIPATLRRARDLDFSSGARKSEQTDFAELSGSFAIKFGVIDNRDLSLRAPLVRASGSGTASIPRRTLNCRVEARLVASTRGQGSQGGEDALAGIAIPAHITGSWSDPTVTIDWQRVIREIASDPRRLANLPGEFANMARGMGISLPGLGNIKIPNISGGHVNPGDVLGGALDGGFDPFNRKREPKPKPQTPPATPTPAPAPPPAPRKAPKRVDDARKTLEGLFGR